MTPTVTAMKYATLLLGLAIALASIAAAQAKRPAPAKGVSKQEYGWVCEVTNGTVKIYKVKGAGSRRKRDAVCE